MSNNAEEVKEHLKSASQGFNQLFNNDLEDSQKTFSTHDSPFHLLGLGVVSFLEAALGMEVCPPICPFLNKSITPTKETWRRIPLD